MAPTATIGPATTISPATTALGIDVGGTGIKAAVVGPGGQLLARRSVPTPARHGADAVLDTVVLLAREVLAEAGPVHTAGLGTAGVVAPDGRSIAHATDALPGWAGTPVAERLEQGIGLPFTVLGDVQAFLAGEAALGAARGAATAVGVMAGTGVGGAVWANGALLRGATGAAGHLGHIAVPGAEGELCPCGRTGHVEALAAGPAMTGLFRRAVPTASATDLRDVARLAAQEHPKAVEVLTRGGRALGTVIGGVVAALDPDVVVLAGGVLDSGPWYEHALRAALSETTLPSLATVSVVRAELGSDAVLLGAAAAGRDAHAT
ncbi:ROK family protein [Streptomyces sp. NPDC058985]|uniref:ROK family protein n=1 Tax=Streptomyces sp. NPDC058985 TaxID=3346684 RepID=UPI0036C6C2F3